MRSVRWGATFIDDFNNISRRFFNNMIIKRNERKRLEIIIRSRGFIHSLLPHLFACLSTPALARRSFSHSQGEMLQVRLHFHFNIRIRQRITSTPPTSAGRPISLIKSALFSDQIKNIQLRIYRGRNYYLLYSIEIL